MNLKIKETRGARKGENRFSNSQQKKIAFRLERIKSVVIPKMRSICEKSHFKNVTAFRKMCAEVYNSELPTSVSQITYRTFGNSPYWEEVGPVYHFYYSSSDNSVIDGMLMSLSHSDEVYKLTLELKNKEEELAVLSETLLNTGNVNPLAIDNKKGLNAANISSDEFTRIDNLAATINWLIERSDDIITIDREKRLIRDESDDYDGELDRNLSSTFFDYLEGKLHK